MERVGTLVVYGASGVCRVEDLRCETLGGTARSYYILKPTLGVGDATIFVPIDNPLLVSQMRRLLDRGEMEALFTELAETPLEAWMSDARARSEYYKSILSMGERRKILSAIRTLRYRERELALRGKRLAISDETVLGRAIDIVTEEMAFVLGLSREDAAAMLFAQVG